jgi:tetraprenyl-beta-curcumene synthase
VCPRGPSVRRTNAARVGAPEHTIDPAPLTARQLRALAAAVVRELIWGLPESTRQTRVWRERAGAIPDCLTRGDALRALRCKRGNTYGAALFWTLAPARSMALLRLLVTFQVMWDFLDDASEHADTGERLDGAQLHLALQDALDPRRLAADYHRHRPARDDGGYVGALVCACRGHSVELSAIQQVRRLLLREATRASVQAVNHDPDPMLRRDTLRAWAAREFPDVVDASWFELTGAAGAGLAIYALLALAAGPQPTSTTIAQTCDAYFPWASAVATMLDSYVDQEQDMASGGHVYVSYYGDPEVATRRIAQLIRRSLRATRSLPHSERHTLVIACMVAMYLSKDSARTVQMRTTRATLMSAGGSLTKALLPILRLWRVAYAQRSS